MALVDIIIVNYKSTDFLINCLGSIYNALNGIEAEIFIEDNNSNDDVDRIKENFPNVILSKNKSNLGFAKATNKAVMKGYAPYLIILNPDTIISTDFFVKLLCYMEENPDVGIVGPMILDRDWSLQGSARTFPTPLTAFFGRSSFLSRWFPGNRFTRKNLLTLVSDGKTPMEVGWVSGACMLVRRKALDDVGLLDERFFMYWEDADWCMRMWQAGWKVTYFPGASVVHFVGGSSDRLVFRSIAEFHKSSYRLFDKYSGSWSKLKKPLVISGLAIRFIAVLAFNGVRIYFDKHHLKKGRHEKYPPSRNKRKIKVMQLIARLNIGGPAIHVSMLSNYLNKDVFESFLVTGRIAPDEGDMGYLFIDKDVSRQDIPEMRREINLLNDTIAIYRIIMLLFRERPDIVDTHTSKAGTIGRLAVFIHNLISSKKVLTVHTFHGHVFDGYFGLTKSWFFVLLERFLAHGTDAIIAISNSQKEELSTKYGIAPPDKIKTIPLGIDLDPFFSSETLKGGVREKIGADGSSFLIGIVGRLVPIKNHFMFFLAAREFLEKNPGSLIKFLVIGDGELKARLENFCCEQGIGDYCHFIGWVKNIEEVYADLNCLALTSMNEGTPVSIIEAMASSVPIISTDVGGVSDLIGPPAGIAASDGFVVCERGILCKRNDASGLAKGMQYLIEEDALERHDRVEKARNFAMKHFSKERLLKDMEELYLGLIKEQRRGSLI